MRKAFLTIAILVSLAAKAQMKVDSFFFLKMRECTATIADGLVLIDFKGDKDYYYARTLERDFVRLNHKYPFTYEGRDGYLFFWMDARKFWISFNVEVSEIERNEYHYGILIEDVQEDILHNTIQ